MLYIEGSVKLTHNKEGDWINVQRFLATTFLLLHKGTFSPFASLFFAHYISFFSFSTVTVLQDDAFLLCYSIMVRALRMWENR